MINGKKVVVVLPAYNAANTLKKTIDEIPQPLVDELVLVDDASKDHTLEVAKSLGIKHIIKHDKNLGYGGNQKSCYNKAIEIGADIIIMLHPDYQYTPKLIPSMVELIDSGLYPVVFGSRILGKGAINGGMPWFKYVANRFLTLFQNILINQKLSEYHTGYRAYSDAVLRNIKYERNSDNFLFDNQVILQIFARGYEIGEITCPTRYDAQSSSINIVQSTRYALGVMWNSIEYFLFRLKLIKPSKY
jgi:glycosyltransferase involved in cell wall biosynthesis